MESGSYQLDPVNRRVLLGFIDDGTGITPPEDLTNFDFQQWLTLIEAKHVFVGALGSMTLDDVRPERVAGTFSGLMMDINDGTLITVSNAGFSLAADPVPVEDTTWGSIKARYQR
jgi:hypothetical protein